MDEEALYTDLERVVKYIEKGNAAYAKEIVEAILQDMDKELEEDDNDEE